MRNLFMLSLAFTLIFIACKKDESDPEPTPAAPAAPVSDVTPPVIVLKGKSLDTTYLQVNYQEPGVVITDNVDGDISSSVVASGAVNAQLTGTYTLIYNAKDAAGNNAATATRTVVVLNRAGIFAGNYSVTSSYTAEIVGDPAFPTPTVTTGNYTSVITSNNAVNGNFNVSALRVGPVDVAAGGYYSGGNSFTLGYNDTWYINGSGGSTVTVSSSRTTFTVQNITLDVMYPSRTFNCRNIFTKQ